MFTTIKTQLLELGVTVILAVISLAGVYLTVYVNKAIKNLQERTKADILYNTLSGLDDLVKTTVTSIEQTLAEELRKAVKDGKVSREELIQLGDVALKRVLDKLGESSLEVLNGTFDDVQGLIKDKIEEAVWNLKQEQEVFRKN